MCYHLTDDSIYHWKRPAIEASTKGKSHLSIIGGKGFLSNETLGSSNLISKAISKVEMDIRICSQIVLNMQVSMTKTFSTDF
jgi:hypothetical protein